MLYIASQETWIIVGLITFVLLIIWAYTEDYKGHKKRNQALQLLANERGGHAYPGIFFLTQGRATIPVIGTDAQLYFMSFGSKNPTHYTWLAMPIQHCEGWTLNIQPEGVLSLMGQAMGMDDIKVGDEDFDARFRLKSNQPERLQALLDEKTRQIIVSLDQLKPEGEIFEPYFVEIEVRGGVLQINSRGRFHTVERMEQFVTLSGQLVRRLQGEVLLPSKQTSYF